MTRAQVSLVQCKQYNKNELEDALYKAVGLLGGINKFIQPKSKVLVKPNLLSARPPEQGVDTHPEFIRAVIRLIKSVTTNIALGDSPGGFDLKDIDKVYEISGVKKVCEEEGIRLIKFDQAVNLEGFPIATAAKDCDSIVSLPKLKTHSATVLTGAVKNTFGMVIGLHKAQCHLRAPMPDEFSRILVKVFSIVKPTLSIMDGIVGMEGEGPAAGPLRDVGVIIASQDAVALDAVFARAVGAEPLLIPTTREAVKRGEGAGDLKQIEILGDQLTMPVVKNFKLPKASAMYKLPGPIIRLGVKTINFCPGIDKEKCKRCELCYKICPKNAIKKLEDGSFWVAAKECIRCFCCYEVCPHNAIELKKSLLARLIMR